MNIYSTFYHAVRPEGIEKKKAYIVGGGIAGLAAAAFLADDAGMPGENITVYEKQKDMGGCCVVDGDPKGYICPGEREIEPYMECLWYLCSKIPSLDTPGRTVLDETVDVNRDSAIHSECRILQNRGHIWEGVHDYRMTPKTAEKLQKFLVEPEEKLFDLTIADYFGADSDFFDSAMWWCFHPMLAFKPYHSALEAQRYLNRFGLANRIDYLEGILHTKRNEYDSIIKPLMVWLEGKGVKIVRNVSVYDIELDEACNTATGIRAKNCDGDQLIQVSPEDLLFVTNGSLVTNARYGDNTHLAETVYSEDDMGLFTIWRNLAKKDRKFGNPEKFLGQVDKTKWMSFFVTITDYPEFFERLEKMTGSKAGMGGAVTVKDSGWNMSVMLYDRDYFPRQKELNQDVLWGDGLFGENIGNYIRKPMAECTGNEILEEMLYHFNMLDIKDDVISHAYVSTCMMPYITSQFMPRTVTDRPRVIPDGCTNLAFIGQYVEVPGDVVFTIETSVRTPMEAVYQLTKLDKEILEVYPCRYDVRFFVERMKKFAGVSGNLTEEDLPKINPFELKKQISELLNQLNAIPPYYIMYQGRDKNIALKDSVLNPQYPKEK
ncbi:MAG: oleate hydratase [Lachnospiraceae bacterium]|jgi:oleate hydratase|nr:oleate hydratase [Lachnospiraceae bacterium]